MSRQTRATTVVSQPPQILDVAGVGAAEPQPGLLHRVFGLAARAEHAIGDRPQAAPVGLELSGQGFFFVHRSHSFVALRHSDDERNPADVTGRATAPSGTKPEKIRGDRHASPNEKPRCILPDALQALLALDKSTANDDLPEITRKLVHLRASQINGCSVCVDMHARELKKAGESDQRIFAVAAWRDTP